MSDTAQTEPSMRSGIAALQVGDTYSRCVRLRLNKVTRSFIVDNTASLRNTMSASMRRAQADTGHEYKLETGNFVTMDGALMVVAAATRLS